MEPIMRQAAITVRLRNEVTALAQTGESDLSRIIDEAFERAARHMSAQASAPDPAPSTDLSKTTGAEVQRHVTPHVSGQVAFVGGPLPAYVVSNYLAVERTSLAPHNTPIQRLAKIAVEIVRVEQPIHAEEVGRRLAAAFGLKMAGNRIQEAALRGLRAARRSGILSETNGFWRVVGAPPQPARDRSQLPPSIGVRRSNLICQEEYAAAARNVLLDRLELSRAELIAETARHLGFARTGPELEKAIGAAIDSQLAKELEQRGDGQLGLRGIDGSTPSSLGTANGWG
jgi:hypothetical protein